MRKIRNKIMVSAGAVLAVVSIIDPNITRRALRS